jgi:hypothetical protein
MATAASAMIATATPPAIAPAITPALVWIRPVTHAGAWIVTRRRLVITRGRRVVTRGRVIVTPILIRWAAAAVIHRGRSGIDLGTVITLASIVIGHARRKGQTEHSNKKQSSIHGGLLDRERAPPATLGSGIQLLLNDETSDIKKRNWCDLDTG